MKHSIKKAAQRTRRQARIRAKVSGTPERPRLSVFKSNKYLSIQVIDDESGKTIVAGTTKGLKAKTEKEKAFELGKKIAEQALVKNIKQVVFDRGGYIYTGKVEALAQGAREGGLSF